MVVVLAPAVDRPVVVRATRPTQLTLASGGVIFSNGRPCIFVRGMKFRQDIDQLEQLGPYCIGGDLREGLEGVPNGGCGRSAI